MSENVDPNAVFQQYCTTSSNGRDRMIPTILQIAEGDPNYLERFMPLVDTKYNNDVIGLFLKAPITSKLIAQISRILDVLFKQEVDGTGNSPELGRKFLYQRLILSRMYGDFGEELTPILLRAFEREEWWAEPLYELVCAAIVTGQWQMDLYINAYREHYRRVKGKDPIDGPGKLFLTGVSRVLLGLGLPVEELYKFQTLK